MVEWHNWMKVSSQKSAQLFNLKLCVTLMKLLTGSIFWEKYVYRFKKMKKGICKQICKIFLSVLQMFTKNLLKTRKIGKDWGISFRLSNTLPLKIKILAIWVGRFSCMDSGETHHTGRWSDGDWAFVT